MFASYGQWKAKQLLLAGIQWEQSLPREVWIVQFCQDRHVYTTYEQAYEQWKFLEHNGRCDFAFKEQTCRGNHTLTRGQNEFPLAGFEDRIRWELMGKREIYLLWKAEHDQKQAEILSTLPFFAPMPSAAPIPGVVYVLMCKDLHPTRVKIGRSTAATLRLETLQTSSPFELIKMREIETDDTAALETALHRRYASYRKCGEWFELPWEIYEEILHREFV